MEARTSDLDLASTWGFISEEAGVLGRIWLESGLGNRSVFVNNSFIHRNNFNAGGSRSLSGSTAWAHDSSHRQGVPYSNAAVSNRYGGAVRQNLQSRAAAGQAQSRAAAGQTQSRAAAGQTQSRAAAGQTQSRAAADRTQSRAAAGQTQSRGSTSSPATERMGNRQIAPSTSRANRSAFGVFGTAARRGA